MAYVATKKPDDFCIAMGEQHSVRDFVNLAAKELDIIITWKGKGLNEKGYDQDGVLRILVDPEYYRPTEVESLLGDASKARDILGWEPKISFHSLVSEMINSDYKLAKREMLILESKTRFSNQNNRN